MSPSDLVAADRRLRRWLFDRALPLWFARGVDWRRGGFFDLLDPKTGDAIADYKRLRVLARQIYVFAQAAAMGWGDGRKAAIHGLDFLFARARRPDGGYAPRFDRDGNVTDDRRTLYDSAFVLLALATAHRVVADDRLRDAAIALLDYLRAHLTHPAGGFAEGRPASLPRQHNGHMHLFEATIAGIENGWGDAFAATAAALAKLFATRFHRAGILPERFDESLAPLAADEDRFTEPGHAYEWAWLLASWGRIAHGPAPPEAWSLYRSQRGDADAPVVDERRFDGDVRLASARLWPQAERVKAALVLGPGDAPAAVAVLERYLDAAAVPGLWRERIAADGAWSDEPVRASSLYHIVAAIAELRRVAQVQSML